MSKKLEEDAYEKLSNAIVLQAVKDYRDSLRKLKKSKRNASAEQMKGDCLRFFHSGWFGELTDIDPEYLLRRLDKEVSG